MKKLAASVVMEMVGAGDDTQKHKRCRPSRSAGDDTKKNSTTLSPTTTVRPRPTTTVPAPRLAADAFACFGYSIIFAADDDDSSGCGGNQDADKNSDSEDDEELCRFHVTCNSVCSTLVFKLIMSCWLDVVVIIPTHHATMKFIQRIHEVKLRLM